jgi:dinuclear metal center YbgI/SA1388 family protein
MPGAYRSGGPTDHEVELVILPFVPTVKEIDEHLAERTRPETAASWDPVGLQLGDRSSKVERVGVCHEVTEEIVAAVEADPVDLLITYHPLLFSPINRIVAGRSPAARALRLIQAGTALLVTHTDFDAAPGGTADALAALFNLTDVKAFGADEEDGVPAVGRYGSFGGTLDALDAMATDAWGIAGLRVSGQRDTVLERVAVVPGSGSDFVEKAAAIADALVTGDVSHHRTVQALDLGLAIVDPGHVATERPGMHGLVTLAGTIPDVEVIDLTGVDPETWS